MLGLFNNISNRNRAKDLYYYEIDSSGNTDLIEVSSAALDLNVPSSGEEFDFHCTFLVPLVSPVLRSAVNGRSSGTGGDLFRYQMMVFETGALTFFYYGSSSLMLLNFINDYGGQVVTVKCGWRDDVNDTRFIEVNDIEVASTIIASPRPVDSSTNFTVATLGSVANRGLDTDYYDFGVKGENWLMNEGVGNMVFSEENEIQGLITTTHANGLTYIDGQWNKYTT